MRFSMLILLVLALGGTGAPTAEAGGEDLATRLVGLESEARRLLDEVARLRASLPGDEDTVRALIRAEYERAVGDRIPDALLARATGDVLRQQGAALRQAVTRAVEEGRKLPLTDQLTAPLVVLQVRSGAGGGNPNTVDMLGGLSIYVDERCRKEIPWSPVVGINEDARAYALGGSIPQGKVFVITKVTWRGVAAGDSNGHGAFIVRVGKQTVASARDDGAVREGAWEGRIVVHAGEEPSVQAEVANSSHLEVRLEGELADAAGTGVRDGAR